MADYNVKQISELLEVDAETVRRWIRTEKLKGSKNSKKTGFVVSEAELKRFLLGIPKYSKIAAGLMVATSVPVMGVPLAIGTLWGSLVTGYYIGKKKKVTREDIIVHIKKEIEKLNTSITQKQATVKQMQHEIKESQNQIKKLQYLLENADLQEIADSVNNKKQT